MQQEDSKASALKVVQEGNAHMFIHGDGRPFKKAIDTKSMLRKLKEINRVSV